MTDFFEPISLGAKCETKYQISRVLNERLWPERSEMTFRYAITRRPRDVAFSRWRLFDWQGTPLRSVCDYLERDFQGTFEIEDIVPTPLGPQNVVFDTNHLHDFIPRNGTPFPTAEEVLEQYPLARREFEQHVEGFRVLLRQPGPYLYVVVDPEEAETQTPRLIRLLECHPAHRFHLLLVDREGANADLPDLGPKVSRTFRKGSSKPAAFDWEGNDESWNAVLEPFKLTRHPDASDGALELGRAAETAGARDWARGVEKKPVWRGGPGAAFCYLFWRQQGASLVQTGDGARIRTIPVEWSYSACIRLDISRIDFKRQRAWARVSFSNVSGHLMLAAYDPVHDRLSQEMLVGARAGAFILEVELTDPAQTQLMLRTGGSATAAEVTIVDVDVAVAPPKA